VRAYRSISCRLFCLATKPFYASCKKEAPSFCQRVARHAVQWLLIDYGFDMFIGIACVIREPSAARNSEHTIPDEGNPMEGERNSYPILLAEDDPISRRLFEKILVKEGFFGYGSGKRS
jgi:hypothetical protein